MTASIPDGFERHFRQSPLTDPWEPLYSKRDGERFLLGVRVDGPHCNARGLAHGGLISALADNAMGLACVLTSGNPGAVTVSLSVDFVGSAMVGHWLEVAAEPVKLGRTLAFATASVTADGEVVARASAVFRMAEQKEA
jgi:uncharacterized protein (TIGR00369 family)